MELSQLDLSKLYTYTDYLSWQFQERVELIRGKIMKMSPAPSRRHQEVSSSLFRLFVQHFPPKSTCKLYHAPFDVRLPNKNQEGEKIETVVQPDLCIVCDRSKLDDKGCLGAPDLIVEILSPGNTKKEMQLKFDLYEESGVLEYWMVIPSQETIQLFVLDENGKFQFQRFYNTGDRMPSVIFEGLEVELEAVFAE